MRETTSRLADQISDASREVTTGLKAQPFDALGHKSADAIAIRMQIQRNDGFIASNTLLDGRFLAVETSLGSIRTAAQDVLDQSFVALTSTGSKSLAEIARSAIDTLIERSAVSDSSGFLMSGTRSDVSPLQGWTEVNPDTGLSPAGIVEDVLSGPMNSLADVQSKIAALKAVFSDSDSTNPSRNFEASFYNGSPTRDANGQVNPPLTVRVSTTETMAQPVQANATAMRDLMRGLAMVSAVDAGQISDPDARAAWIDEARNAIANGISGTTELETNTGVLRSRLSTITETQQSRGTLLAKEQLLLEGTDQYDAATRLTQLQTQLESSYAVTARLSRLSFLNYL
ncbi:flagellar hook-associated protein 3 FlgL [Loktanella atrilutea]|uniref:Flagellar hook-associated protein 3 FlgL n=1 Tax=Loktanella atrilutea TaxID=366533 RepID=A0A1M5C5K9_LOKAT|nr:flagellin [Loktanella atrilutea]SHF50005.1 flagellar hook-associated protein 3 FlgL [Loktanella atrilutea]